VGNEVGEFFAGWIVVVCSRGMFMLRRLCNEDF
jgi:hypothetical protein